jgi:hypothetical protein
MPFITRLGLRRAHLFTYLISRPRSRTTLVPSFPIPFFRSVTSCLHAMSHDKRSALAPIPCRSTGHAVLTNPHLNKGSVFSAQERHEFGLTGLLPSYVDTLDGQALRAMEQYRTHRTDVGRNVFLTSMKEQNTVLYYRLLQDHLKEMFSIIYTPTEGEAIANYSRIFRRSEGCFLDIESMDDIESALSHWNADDIDIITCSDGEQILGGFDRSAIASVAQAKLMCAFRYRRSRSGRRADQCC